MYAHKPKLTEIKIQEPPQWVFDAWDHYYRTGSFRSIDRMRLCHRSEAAVDLNDPYGSLRRGIEAAFARKAARDAAAAETAAAAQALLAEPTQKSEP
jgi:hypothetical protein